MLKYYDFSWLDNSLKDDPDTNVLDVINNYRKGTWSLESKILNVSSIDRTEATTLSYSTNKCWYQPEPFTSIIILN